MRLLIRYLDGSFGAAIPMATIGGRLRVAVAGSDDVVEFRFADGRWLAENGQAVEIEFDAAPDEFYWWAQQAAVLRGLPDAPTQEFNSATPPYVASIAPVS
jgi:hypothetical protein